MCPARVERSQSYGVKVILLPVCPCLACGPSARSYIEEVKLAQVRPTCPCACRFAGWGSGPLSIEPLERDAECVIGHRGDGLSALSNVTAAGEARQYKTWLPPRSKSSVGPSLSRSAVCHSRRRRVCLRKGPALKLQFIWSLSLDLRLWSGPLADGNLLVHRYCLQLCRAPG